MLILPKNLASLARLCARDGTRYAFHGVRLTEHTEGYRVDASDGHCLAIVTGPGREEEIPSLLAHVANGAWQALIPAKLWTDAFRAAAPLVFRGPPVIQAVIGEQVTTFATGNSVFTAPNLEGNYPDVDRLAREQSSLFAVQVDARRLVELLLAADAIRSVDDASHAVTLHFQGSKVPLLLSTDNTHGQRFQAAIMPLGEVKK